MKINIRPYVRRGKKGNTIKVSGYSRRIGRKGVHSPKTAEQSQGVELEKRQAQMLSPEEISRRREVMADFKRAEEERQRLNLTKEQYSLRKLSLKDSKPKMFSLSDVKKKRRHMNVYERIEDRLARFTEKHGHRYKRQL